MYKKILIFALSILSTPCAMHNMELILQREEQEDLNERLCKAIHAQNVKQVEFWLKAGADPNALIHRDSCAHHPGKQTWLNRRAKISTLCYSTATKPNYKICKLLFKYGANLEIESQSRALNNIANMEKATLFDMYNLFFDYGARHAALRPLEYDVHGTPPAAVESLIICAVFNPKLDFNFFPSYNRVMALLMTLKRKCPKMPKDIRQLIVTQYLTADFETMTQYGKLSSVTAEHAYTIPMQIVRMLIERGQLNPEMTITTLKRFHIKQTSRYMYAAEELVTRGNPERLWRFNPPQTEEHFGDEIEKNIRRRLGVPEKESWNKRLSNAFDICADVLFICAIQ